MFVNPMRLFATAAGRALVVAQAESVGESAAVKLDSLCPGKLVTMPESTKMGFEA